MSLRCRLRRRPERKDNRVAGAPSVTASLGALYRREHLGSSNFRRSRDGEREIHR
jgi:hypothetical protein